MQPISIAESARLNELEKTIKDGLRTFVAVGTALAEIRDSRLSRAEYPSFDNYVQAELGIKKSYAYQIIESAGVAQSVSAIADIRVETHARALAPVPPEKRAEVLAAAGDQPTARSIKEAAAAVLAPIVMQATAAPDAKDAPADKPKRKYTKRNLPAAATAGSASARSAVTPPAADSSFPAAHVASKPSEQSAGEAGNGSPAKLVSDEMAARQMADKNFFAIQFEEIASAVVDDGTDEQLEAAVKSAKKAVKDLQAEQKQRRKF